MTGFVKQVLICLSLITALPVNADNIAAAKEKIEAGRALIAKKDFVGALSAFKDSYRLRPKPWVMFNIAMCQKALHRYVDAINSFRIFLKTEENPTEATRSLAKEALRVLEQLVGEVRLMEAPDRAEVSVDGERVATTPLDEPLAMDPGRHVITISKDKFKTLNVEVIVASGAELEVRADLEQPRAEIRVVCEGERTVVFVDDAAVGKCPYQGEVAAGVHEIKVIEPGKETFTQAVEVTAGATLVIAVELPSKIVLDPPTFLSEPVGAETSKLTWGVRIGGITALGLGALSFGLGGVFTAKWNNAYESVEEAVERVNAANSPYNEPTWQEEYEDYEDEKRTANTLHTAMVVGYAVGGSLIVAGTGLLVWSLIMDKHEKEDEKITLRPLPGGLCVTF